MRNFAQRKFACALLLVLFWPGSTRARPIPENMWQVYGLGPSRMPDWPALSQSLKTAYPAMEPDNLVIGYHTTAGGLSPLEADPAGPTPHIERSAESAYEVSLVLGSTPAEAHFDALVYLLHDVDPAAKGIKPQPEQTLELMARDWRTAPDAQSPLLPGHKGSLLKEWGFDELKLQIARTMIARTKFPWNGEARALYSREVDALQSVLGQRFGASSTAASTILAKVMLKSAVMSELADVGSLYAFARFNPRVPRGIMHEDYLELLRLKGVDEQILQAAIESAATAARGVGRMAIDRALRAQVDAAGASSRQQLPTLEFEGTSLRLSTVSLEKLRQARWTEAEIGAAFLRGQLKADEAATAVLLEKTLGATVDRGIERQELLRFSFNGYSKLTGELFVENIARTSGRTQPGWIPAADWRESAYGFDEELAKQKGVDKVDLPGYGNFAFPTFGRLMLELPQLVQAMYLENEAGYRSMARALNNGRQAHDEMQVAIDALQTGKAAGAIDEQSARLVEQRHQWHRRKGFQAVRRVIRGHH